MELQCTDEEIHQLLGLNGHAQILPTSIPKAIPEPSQAEEPRDKDTALKLVNQGWTVRGPYKYGSISHGQSLGLRLQDPHQPMKHKVFCLPEEDMEEILAIAKLRGQFRERTLQELKEEENPPEPEKPAPDLLVPEQREMKIAVKCRKCDKTLKSVVNNRFISNTFKQVQKEHYEKTGHRDTCYLEEVKAVTILQQ
jgi:hypothetical protein